MRPKFELADAVNLFGAPLVSQGKLNPLPGCKTGILN
jgi:hypothetical protein